MHLDHPVSLLIHDNISELWDSYANQMQLGK